MRIDIWSDVACPWCYIGLARFAKVLQDYEHATEVTTRLHAFQLDPTLPEQAAGSEADYLALSKGASREQVTHMLNEVARVARADGLPIDVDRVRPANTWRAHRLIQAAHRADPGGETQWRIDAALFEAHFANGEVISDANVLQRIAEQAGMDVEVAREALADAPASNPYGGGDDLDAAVRADLSKAAQWGITSVPFFVIDDQYGIAGAQPAEVFVEALRRVWDESHPAPSLKILEGLGVDAGAGGPVCGPNGCA